MVDRKIFEDIARVAGGALGSMTGLKGEIEAFVRQKVEFCLERMQLVNREEFELVKEMLIKSRMEQEKLVQRIEVLEQRVAAEGKDNV